MEDLQHALHDWAQVRTNLDTLKWALTVSLIVLLAVRRIVATRVANVHGVCLQDLPEPLYIVTKPGDITDPDSAFRKDVRLKRGAVSEWILSDKEPIPETMDDWDTPTTQTAPTASPSPL